MTDKNGVGVTVVGHDSETRTLVNGYGPPGSYVRNVHYIGVGLTNVPQLAGLLNMSANCEQFIKFYKCACGVTNSCADSSRGRNCDKKDDTWREDSGLLTEKSHLPVLQLKFGDTGGSSEKGYHTLGKLKCYGMA